MKNKIFLFSVFVLLIFSAACQTSTTNTAPTAIPSPEAGKANVTGTVVSINTGEPYNRIIVRLAEIYRNEQGEGAYALDASFSPFAETDANGKFVFKNIEAREYVLVFGDPMTKYSIVTDETGSAKVWNIPSDKVTDLGEFKIDFDY
jgi:hypothetical protein